MQHSIIGISGLNQQQVEESRIRYGSNKIDPKKENHFFNYLKHMIKDPMLLLLVAASGIYFFHGSFAEGIFMLAAIVLVSSISLYQESKSRNALNALKELTQPKCNVIRNNTVQELKAEDIVIGDYIMIEEGVLVPADAVIIQSNDFAVNESILTGESLPVTKDSSKDDPVYQGTLVVSGLAICKVTQIGIQTRVGKIGKSLQEIEEERSPLQVQIADFVKKMAIAGGAIFIIIWGINFFRSKLILESLLKALTLAMSILPEEIPVAFATFMALGAWRLMQSGIIVKQTRTVETLGSATVICVDKTGTITKNEMSLAKVYVHKKEKIFDIQSGPDIEEVVTIAMWASEPIPFDPMETSLHQAYGRICKIDLRSLYKLVHEYPLSGQPPLMTHIFSDDKGNKVIAAKGAPEAILRLSDISDNESQKVMEFFRELANEGYRVLGVGEAKFSGHYPRTQHEFRFSFKGLVAFYDPPKENIKKVMQSFYEAGIQVKIITGDNDTTTKTVARQIDFKGAERSITGAELLTLTDTELGKVVNHTNIFTRMFPEAKLRIIQTLKEQKHVVAMTGDGVNDGPALKAAHIGIAMGRKGSALAKQASALILADDDLSRMVEAIAMGRKIYNNLKKAIQYIISIHIPIVLIVFIPLVSGWLYPTIFTPVHIIFFELIMGPTCSIIYENEPIEKNLMKQKPRKFTTTFFSTRELSISIIQGLMITTGLIAVYWIAINMEKNENVTTAMVFLAIITSNILLTLENRSFYYSIVTSRHYKNRLIPLVIMVTMFLVTAIFLIPAWRAFFKFEMPGLPQFLVSTLVGTISVVWFEGYKWVKRKLTATGG